MTLTGRISGSGGPLQRCCHGASLQQRQRVMGCLVPIGIAGISARSSSSPLPFFPLPLTGRSPTQPRASTSHGSEVTSKLGTASSWLSSQLRSGECQAANPNPALTLTWLCSYFFPPLHDLPSLLGSTPAGDAQESPRDEIP